MGRRRVARFIGLFPEAIDLMVRALRAGLPVTEAIINAGQEIGDPVGAEFRGIEAGMRLGRDLDSLLWDIAKRISAPEFRFFIIALSVQRETGGNLAETLNNLVRGVAPPPRDAGQGPRDGERGARQHDDPRLVADPRDDHPQHHLADLHRAAVHRRARADAGRRRASACC